MTPQLRNSMCLLLAQTICQHTLVVMLFTNSQIFLLGLCAYTTCSPRNRNLPFQKKERHINTILEARHS